MSFTVLQGELTTGHQLHKASHAGPLIIMSVAQTGLVPGHPNPPRQRIPGNERRQFFSFHHGRSLPHTNSNR
ncbi:hypothetical protein, partial [Arthrobacter sp.]|uniref:hypothetical protein n=1 Tax=Arthrobacter sp. TaxID=1667 RepID=UPI0026DEB4C5